MAFRFRLETLLRYRQDLEDAAERELGRQAHILTGLQEELAAIGRRLATLRQELEIQQAEGMAVVRLRLYLHGISHFERLRGEQETRIQVQAHAVDKARADLVRRRQERQIVERLRERQAERYLLEERRHQDRQADAMAVLRFRHAGPGEVSP
ncbi:MAG: flagellar export protein FliJ [Thermodesulfobacteriota bacterium]